MTLFIAAIVLALFSTAWVIHPIIRRNMAPIEDPLAGGILDAEARKRVALASLKDIEYDRLGGKLDDEDYTGLRVQLEREAVAAIHAVDVATGQASSVPIAGSGVGDARHACGFSNPAASRFCSGCGVPLG